LRWPFIINVWDAWCIVLDLLHLDVDLCAIMDTQCQQLYDDALDKSACTACCFSPDGIPIGNQRASLLDLLASGRAGAMMQAAVFKAPGIS
jgi:hypothetical protein